MFLDIEETKCFSFSKNKVSRFCGADRIVHIYEKKITINNKIQIMQWWHCIITVCSFFRIAMFRIALKWRHSLNCSSYLKKFNI